MLDIQILAKNSKHWQKKIYKKFAVSDICRTFALGNGNKTRYQKLFVNTESEKADRDGSRFLGFLPFVLMLYKNGKKV